MSQTLKMVLIGGAGLIAFLWLYLFSFPGGDFGFFLLHAYLNKIHLKNSFEFPFLTPLLCGGFVLGSDPQNLIHSIFFPLAMIFQKVHLGLEFGIFLSSSILTSGFYFWLKDLGVTDPFSRLASAIILGMSGYWYSHIHGSAHLAAHGIAYLPWLMHFLESLLKVERKNSFQKDVLIFTLLSFLILNSGYQWVQVFLPILIARIFVEAVLLVREKERMPIFFRAVGVGALGSIFTLGLSLPRLVSIFDQTLSNFPREIPILSVVGSNKVLIEILFKAFFDARILTQHLGEPHLGGWWEWTMYLGLLSIPLILLGGAFLRLKSIHRAWLALLLACLFQYVIDRTTHAAQLLRDLIPVLNGITYYYRGSFVFVFFLMTLAAMGISKLNTSEKPWIRIFTLIFTLGWGGEFLYVYSKANLIHPNDVDVGQVPYLIPAQYRGIRSHRFFDKKLREGSTYALVGEGWGPYWCYNPLIEYNNSKYHPQWLIDADPAFEVKKGFYNLTDVTRVFGPEGKGGKFSTETWPLWPQSKEAEFKAFTEFKQVMEPQRFRFAVRVFWVTVFLLASFVALGWVRKRMRES